MITKKVKFTESIAWAGGAYIPSHPMCERIYTLPKEVAEGYIKRGVAVEVIDPVEEATAEPKVENAITRNRKHRTSAKSGRRKKSPGNRSEL